MSRQLPITPFAIKERERYFSEASSCRYATLCDFPTLHATAVLLPYTTEAAKNKLRDEPRQTGIIIVAAFVVSGTEYRTRMPSFVERVVFRLSGIW